MNQEQSENVNEIRPSVDDIDFLKENIAWQAFQDDLHKEWLAAMNKALDENELKPQQMAYTKGYFRAFNYVYRTMLVKLMVAAKIDDQNRSKESTNE